MSACVFSDQMQYDMFINLTWPAVIFLFIAGKMFNDIQGTVNTNMNAEIFPTVVRGQALFFVAIIANIAGAISPFFMMLVSKMHY